MSKKSKEIKSNVMGDIGIQAVLTPYLLTDSDFIYEGTTPAEFEDATGIVTNRAPKLIDKNVKDIAEYVNTKVVHVGDATTTVTVGPGGNFTTITEALGLVSKISPEYQKGGMRLIINLLSSFVFNEEIHIDGIDMSYVTINTTKGDTAYDANPAAIVTPFNDFGHMCLIGVKNGGVSPVFNFNIRFTSKVATSQKNAFFAYNNGTILGEGRLGVTDSSNDGFSIHLGSVLAVKGNLIANGSSQHGVSCTHGSVAMVVGTLTANDAVFSGIFAAVGSQVGANWDISTQNATEIGCDSRLGSTITSDSKITTNYSGMGCSAAAGSVISCRLRMQNFGCNYYGAVAGVGSSITTFESMDNRVCNYWGCAGISGGRVSAFEAMWNTGWKLSGGAFASHGGSVTARENMDNIKSTVNSTKDTQVFWGGYIARNGGSGGTNNTRGVMNANGYINK